MKALCAILFMLAAIIFVAVAANYADTTSTADYPAITEAGAACGFAVSAGLSLIAMAIVLAGPRSARPPEP